MKVVEVPIEYYICLLEYELAHFKAKNEANYSWTTYNKINSLERNLKFYQDQANQSAITIVPDLSEVKVGIVPDKEEIQIDSQQSNINQVFNEYIKEQDQKYTNGDEIINDFDAMREQHQKELDEYWKNGDQGNTDFSDENDSHDNRLDNLDQPYCNEY